MIRSCPRCEGKLLVRSGRKGKFLGCTHYPQCKHTENLAPSGTRANTPWVTASEIGKATFCANTVYLRRQGIFPPTEAIEAMQEGTQAHEVITAAEQKIQTDKRCYIATYAFSEDHPVVIALREWRDQHLNSTWVGRQFINTYYTLSPLLIKLFKNSHLFKSCTTYLVLWLYRQIQRD